MTQDTGRRERKKEETQKRIIETAMGLFERQGYDATTMEEIAEEADISRPTLYNYFRVKEAIVASFFQQVTKGQMWRVQELVETVKGTRNRLLKYFSTTTKWVEGHREIYRVYVGYRSKHLLNHVKNAEIRSGPEQVVAAIIKAGQDEGEVRCDISPDILARNLDVMLLPPHIAWLADPVEFPLMPQIAVTVEIFLNGAAQRRDNR